MNMRGRSTAARWSRAAPGAATRRVARTALLRLLLVTATWTGHAAGAAEEPAERQFGPFVITVHGKRTGDGGLFMRTGNPFGTQRMREYSVSHRGRTLVVPALGERHSQVLELPDAPRPALLLASGPHYHLVIDEGDRAEVRALAPEASDTALQWLDSHNGQPGPPGKGYGLEHVDSLPDHRLAGGRLLYLRHRIVLDVGTLTTRAVEPWWRQGKGKGDVEMNASNSPAIALSPRRTRFVLAGDGRDWASDERFMALLVVDLATGKPDGVRIDPGLARPGQGVPIDAAFVARHYRWELDAQGREQLVPRPR